MCPENETFYSVINLMEENVRRHKFFENHFFLLLLLLLFISRPSVASAVEKCVSNETCAWCIDCDASDVIPWCGGELMVHRNLLDPGQNDCSQYVPYCLYDLVYYCAISGALWGDQIEHSFGESPPPLWSCGHCLFQACGTGQCCGTNTEVGSKANYSTGNLYVSRDVVSSKGGNLSLSFSLAYNSREINFHPTIPLGKGWTHNYNMSIYRTNQPGYDGILLIEGDGKKTLYGNAGSGTYRPQQGSADYSTIILIDGVYQLTRTEGTVYAFDSASGKLLSITDRNSNSVSLAYTGENLTSITDVFGRNISLSYDEEGKIISVTDPVLRTTQLSYDTDGFLLSVTDPAGNAWHYTYNTTGDMLTKTDPAGYMTIYTYDTQRKLTSSTTPAGTKSISYGTGNIATITERDGGVWTYKYNVTLSKPIEVTGPDGGKTISTYDANGNLLTKKDPKGYITTYTYDGSGNMLTMTDPLNHTTTYTYNEWGQVTSITDPDGNVTSYAYDVHGNQISMTDPSGAVTQYQHDAHGNVTTITTPAGQVTTITYDQYGNPSTVTDPSGAVSTLTYDIYGDMTGYTDALGNTTTLAYNILNQLMQQTDPAGQSSYTYDAKGNTASVTDPKGKVTSYEYNYNNQPEEVTDALGNVTSYTYGGAGCQSCGGGTDKLTSVTDAVFPFAS